MPCLLTGKRPTLSEDLDYATPTPRYLLTPHLRTQPMRRSTRLDLDLWLGN